MTFQFVLSSLEIGSSLSFGVLNYFFLNTQGKEISSYLRSTSRKRDLWERYSVGAGWVQSWRPQAAHKPLNQAHKGKGSGWRQAGTKCSPHCPLQCWHPQQNCLLADCSSCERVAREIEERHFWHHKSILRELDARCSQWHCGWNHWF